MHWNILAGEFPPAIGGVGSHTRVLAAELAAIGHTVTVYTGRSEHRTEGRVRVFGAPRGWTRRGLAELSRELDAQPRGRRLLIPYAPNVFGRRGFNFDICSWLGERSAGGDEIHLIVHEPFYPWRLFDKPSRWLLAAAHRHMIKQLLQASAKVYVSTSAWQPMLRPLSPTGAFTLMPSFSNVPVGDGVKTSDGAPTIIGTFGRQPETLHSFIRDVAARVLNPQCHWLFIGDGSDDLAAAIKSGRPQISAFVSGTGRIDDDEVSRMLTRCDVAAQPYIDGITTRRTTTMAWLAHGVAVVTNEGHLTEAWWKSSGAIATVQRRAAPFADAVVGLLANPVERRAVGTSGRQLYEARFAPRHAARILSGTVADVVHAAVG